MTLARPWAVPGTPGLEHRIGGLEKADITGNVSYDPENHHRMQLLRQEKVAGIADDIPELEVFGPQTRATCWSSAGAAPTAPSAAPSSGCRQTGKSVAHAHLRHLNPFPRNLGDVLEQLQAGADPGDQPRPAADAHPGAVPRSTPSGYNRVRGKPFRISEIEEAAERLLRRRAHREGRR